MGKSAVAGVGCPTHRRTKTYGRVLGPSALGLDQDEETHLNREDRSANPARPTHSHKEN